MLPKIFCITLRQTPDRTRDAKAHFDEMGLDVEFFYGIHGKTFGLKPEFPYPGEPDKFISQGYLGLTLSHVMLWTMLTHLPFDEVLVLEDDAFFAPDFGQEFAASYSDLPADWDVVYVGSCCTQGKPTTRVSDRVFRVMYPLCMHALLIRKRALPILLETNRIVREQIDIQVERLTLPKLNHYCFLPSLVRQKTVEQIWFGSCHDLTYHEINGSDEFENLYRTQIERCDEGLFVEVGKLCIKTASFAAARIKLLGKRIRLVCIGPDSAAANRDDSSAPSQDAARVFREQLARCGVFEYVQEIVGDPLGAVDGFSPGSIDFLYVHERDLKLLPPILSNWLSRMKHGGVLAGHTDHPEETGRVLSAFGGACHLNGGQWSITTG